MEVIKSIFAVFAGLPFVTFVLLWIAFTLWMPEKKKAVQLAMDITTLLLVVSVSAMYQVTFDSAMGFWFIVLMFAVMAGLIGNAQNRLKGRVDYRKMARAVWRIGFVVLCVSYIILLFIGIGDKFTDV